MEVYDLIEEVTRHARGFVELLTVLLKYRVLFRSSGLEFSGLREYCPGEDDASRIEWKSSLRAQKIYIKLYEEEKDLDIVILFDSSANMLFGTQERTKEEYAAIIAATISFAATEVGDNVGFAMFNEKLVATLEPSKSSSQYFQILKSLCDKKNYGGKCNMVDALTTMINTLRDRTALFIISDFTNPGDIDEIVKMCAGKFNKVYGIMVRDPRDEFLPKGLGYITLSDPHTGQSVTVDADQIREKFEREALNQSKYIESLFIGGGAGFIKLFTNEPFSEPTIRYLKYIEGA